MTIWWSNVKCKQISLQQVKVFAFALLFICTNSAGLGAAISAGSFFSEKRATFSSKWEKNPKTQFVTTSPIYWFLLCFRSLWLGLKAFFSPLLPPTWRSQWPWLQWRCWRKEVAAVLLCSHSCDHREERQQNTLKTLHACTRAVQRSNCLSPGANKERICRQIQMWKGLSSMSAASL